MVGEGALHRSIPLPTGLLTGLPESGYDSSGSRSATTTTWKAPVPSIRGGMTYQ